jgi:Kef-type K+ transport system membrane component KefB
MTEQHIMFLILLGAAAIPFLARRLRVPSSALEIVFGILLFRVLLDHRPQWVDLFKEIGLIYLMFIAGMELDLRQVLKSGRALWYLLIPLFSLVVTPLAFVLSGYPFYLGIAVAMISAGMVIPLLKEAGMVKTPVGRHIIGVALTGELLSIMVLTLIDAYHLHGLSLLGALQIFRLVLLLGAGILVIKVLYLAAWWHPQRVEKVMESEDPVEEGIRVVISVAFAGGLLAAGAGVEPILGSFMAGVIFSYVFKSKERFEEKINAVGFGFFIPFFFIGVGSGFDLSQLENPGRILFALILTGAIFLSNIFPLLLARFMRLHLREALGMSLVLSAPLSLLVVAGALGEKMGLISAEMNGTLVLAAILSSIVFPSLFRPLGKTLTSGSGD